MGAIAESESLLRRVVPDDQGFNPEDPDTQKVFNTYEVINKVLHYNLLSYVIP